MKKINPRLRIIDRKIRWIFAFALVALVLFLAVLFEQKAKQEHTRQWVDLTNQTIKKIDTVWVLLSETESATRGYLTTKDTTLRLQVFELHSYINLAIAGLRKLTEDNGLQQYNIRKLQQLCTEKEYFQKEFLSGVLSAEVLSNRIGPEGKGVQITRSIKTLLGSMREIEKGLLTTRILQNESSHKTSVYTTLGGAISAFLLVIAILVQLNKDIYLRKKAEEEAAQSESKYKSLIENAGVVMFTADENGFINFANNRVVDLTGYSVEELLGKHFSTLIDPSKKEEVITFYANQFKQKIPATNLEFLICTKPGLHKWVEQSAQLLLEDRRITGFQCMVKDITEKKLVEQELNQSETRRKENEYRLNAILDNSTALIYIKDLHGRYVMANEKFKTFFGLTDEMVIGKTDHDFNPKALADHFKKTDEEVIGSLQPIEIEELMDTPHGRKNLLLLKFPLLTPDKTLLGVSGIATDVTENAEMRRQNIEALQKAESAQQIQEQFLANMSHEIRTPMNGIQGMTKLLLETDLTEEQTRFTNIISRSLNNLVVIVNNVLDFSNLKTGKLTLDSFAFDITEILEEVKKYFEHPLANKGLEFRLTIADGVPRFVKGDAFRLKQILTNLVDNAIKFTDKGYVELHVDIQEHKEQHSNFQFTLTDTGIGIPKDKLDTIFESFAQAGKNISRGYGGAGLGLTISKGLIDLQGGSITVNSRPGEGSVFTFHIPFGLTHNEDTVTTQSDYSARLAGKRILVVEDNQVNQRLIDFVLKKVNVSVDLASNGKEAITLCEKNPFYDLIIMDLQMPVMDGYETTMYLRQQLKLTTPIIAMTATALKEDQERSMQVGMNDFMIKPFDFNDLYTRMLRLLFNTDKQAGNKIQEQAQVQVQEKEPAKEEEPLYDLSLLKELDDNQYLTEVLSFFIENAPTDIKELQPLVDKKDWEALYKKAHKIKGAAAMLQSTRLAGLLANIESNAKTLTNIETVPGLVKDAVSLFAELDQALRKELNRIKKELS